jgi:tetratricopeptide (TPR) repeat protein
MSWRRLFLSLILGLLLSSALPAQIQVGDRPEVVKPDRPQTREELQRRQAAELLREAQALYGAGLLQGRSDRLLDALAALEKVIQLDPDAVEPRRALIPIYLAVGREAEALDTCAEVLDRDPADYETAYHRFKILRQAGKPKEAITALTVAVKSKSAESRPERLLIMLAELAAEHELTENWSEAEAAHRRAAQVLADKRQVLLATGEMQPDALDASVAQSYEHAGRCCLQAQRYADALAAFRTARDRFAAHADEKVRLRANRLNWHLCETAVAQEKWHDALTYLDLYLEQHPAALAPYERKITLLRHVGRQGDIIPSVRKAAALEPHHVGIQLLLARELSQDTGSRREAEALYLKLAERYVNPDVYRGLFKLYQSIDRMEQVLDLLDSTLKAMNDEGENVPAEQRESAADRFRAMLAVLKEDADLVGSLLPVAMRELRGRPQPQQREPQTRQLLAALAAKARKLDDAEQLLRECLPNARWNAQADAIYGALFEVLWRAHKYEAVVELCQEALEGPRRLRGVDEGYFHDRRALALSQLGKDSEALPAIDTAIKQSITDEHKVRRRIVRVRILNMAGRNKEAIADSEVMLKEFTKSGDIRAVRLVLAHIYQDMGEHAKSEDQLRILLELEPNDALACNNLGYQLADRSRDLDEAERLIRRALEITKLERASAADDETATFVDSLGWVLFRKGKLDESRIWLEKATRLADGIDEPVIWDHLGDVYFKLNEPTKAKHAWEKAVKFYEHDRRSKKEGRQEEARRKLKLLQTSADR